MKKTIRAPPGGARIMKKNIAMKLGIDLGLKFGIAPFQNDKETTTSFSGEGFLHLLKCACICKRTEERQSFPRVQGFPTFSSVFYLSTKFPARVLEQKALNYFFFKLHINIIIPPSREN